MGGGAVLGAVLERVFMAGADGSTMATLRLRLGFLGTRVGCIGGEGDGIVEGVGCTLGTGAAGAFGCCIGTLGSAGFSAMLVGFMGVPWSWSMLSLIHFIMDLSCCNGLGVSVEV